MKVKITIGRKIGSGFAVLLITTLVIFVLTYDTLRAGREINDKINKVYTPSVSSLVQLKSSILRSRTLINMWALVPSKEDTKEKLSLVNVIHEEIPAIKSNVDSLSIEWKGDERNKIEKIYQELDKLLGMYSEVQSTLRDLPSYDDPFSRFTMNEFAEEDGLIFKQARIVLDNLNALIETQKEHTVKDSIVMIRSFDSLEKYLKNFSLGLLLFGVLIALLTVRSITKPVFKLKGTLIELGKGKIPSQTIIVRTGDEVGEMSLAMDNLVSGLKRTTQFAHEVGKGDFETSFEPLSNEDVLGNALLVMRDGLKENEAALKRNEQDLERKVDERTRELEKQKNRIEKQNELHKELYENITASIHYAKRLQDNILPSVEYINKVLEHSFNYFKPKDIVSGDFYYVREIENKVVFAAVDCTGHGVPGAFMSLVGHNALNRSIAENSAKMDPAEILKALNTYALNAFSRSDNEESDEVKDGMDIALCVYDRQQGSLEYAGAYSPMYHVRNNEVVKYKADKIPIGSPDRKNVSYTKHTIQLEENDMIYVFTDGYADQFGGEKGKKFLYKPFRELLEQISKEKLSTQRSMLQDTMEAWRKGGVKVQEQVDDMLIIGVCHKSV